MKTIIRNFTRDFSVWQQEIEIEANLNNVVSETGIKCSLFIFENSIDNKVTAYRIKDEQDALPAQYLKLATKENYSKNLYEKVLPIFHDVKDVVKKQVINFEILGNLRKQIVMLWPAYLYGYNLIRYAEKGIFKPNNPIEKSNLVWADKIHHLLEGIYDHVETTIGKALENNSALKIKWQLLPTQEIFDLISGKISSTPSRKLPFVVDETGINKIAFEKYCEKNELSIYSTDSIEHKQNLKGMPAYKGIAKGRVRIVSKRNPGEFKNFQKGDILVSITVSPIFLPMIEKAAAIVTDQGGLTSHATILARELQIPCVVKTHTATQDLLNGDLVEVDANNGIIKKIK